MRNFLFIAFIGLSFVSIGQKDTVIFSHTSGFYDSPIELKLSNNSGNKIFYSLDGTYPKKTYKKPIPISKSTTVRVKNEKILQGQVQNYILEGRKITLPVVCLTINPSDLYDPVSGIYVKGPNAKKDPPYFGANFHKGWEKMAYIELIDTNGLVEFNQKVGVKIFGQFSAMLPQKSFAVYARNKYGKKKIKAKVFPNQSQSKYKSFILRNSGSDYCNTHFRDAMMTSLVKDFNIESQDYRSCVVYLNGDYWGIYHIREKINEHFIKQHSGIDKDSVSILKYRGHPQHNRRMNYKNMLKFITKNDFSVQSNIDSLSKLMDIDNYLDYNIAQVYFNNIDAGGNIRFWRSIKDGGKWRWILFDTDFGFGLRKGNEEDQNTVKAYMVKSNSKWPYPAWSTLIIRKLMENDSLKAVYLRKFTQHLNHTFTPNNVKNHINSFVELLNPEIEYHFKKWKRSGNIWKTQVAKVIRFSNDRPGYLYNYLQESFEKDTTHIITVGKIENGNLVLNNSKVDSGFSGKYFSQIKYKAIAQHAIGYAFSHWSHDSTLQTDSIEIELAGDIVLEPKFKRNNDSEFKGEIYFNEICKKDSLLSDYIELLNNSDQEIDVSGWILIDNLENKFVFPANSIVGPKSFITVFQKETTANKSKGQVGLFRLNKEVEIYLYSNKEELVEKISLEETRFKNKEIIERVNTMIKKGWVASDKHSINLKNSAQKKSEENNKYITIGFLFLLGLLLLAILIFYIRKIWLRGATE